MKIKIFIPGFFLFLLFVSVACEEPAFEPVPSRERTYLHVLNAFSGVPGIDVRMKSFDETRVLADGLPFNHAWPRTGYASLLTSPDPDSINGAGGVQLQLFDTDAKTPLVDDRLLKLAPEVYSTLAIIDSFGKPLVVKTIDIFPKTGNGKALIRFMNLEYKALSATLVSHDDSVRIPRLNFLNYSTFQEFAAGTKTFFIYDDFTGEKLATLSNIDIGPGKAYSFFLTTSKTGPTAGYEILD